MPNYEFKLVVHYHTTRSWETAVGVEADNEEQAHRKAEDIAELNAGDVDFTQMSNENSSYDVEVLECKCLDDELTTVTVDMPREVLNAFKHVRLFHPDVDRVTFWTDGRWAYMNEDHELVVFDAAIDTAVLEDAANAAEASEGGLPASYQLPPWPEDIPSDATDHDDPRYDNRIAQAEGWGLFCIDGVDHVSLQRDDEAAVFVDDDAAIGFVRDRAADGSAYHRKAIALHDKYNTRSVDEPTSPH